MTKTTIDDRDGFRITTVDHTVPDDTFEAAVKELWRVKWDHRHETTRDLKCDFYIMEPFIDDAFFSAGPCPAQQGVETFVAPNKGHDWDLSLWRDGGTNSCRKCGMGFAYFMKADEPACVHADGPPHQWVRLIPEDHFTDNLGYRIDKQCVNCGEMASQGSIPPYGPCKSNSQES